MKIDRSTETGTEIHDFDPAFEVGFPKGVTPELVGEMISLIELFKNTPLYGVRARQILDQIQPEDPLVLALMERGEESLVTCRVHAEELSGLMDEIGFIIVKKENPND